MTWVRLDDQFPDHPKVVNLSDRAFRLHVWGICYSARFLTDGLIQRDAIPEKYRTAPLRALVVLCFCVHFVYGVS
jgi:hypothetical protein